MNAGHRKTLEAIFAEPVRSNVRCKDIESMMVALGAGVFEGSGSRVRIEFNGLNAVFHRPHPKPDTDKGAVKSVRRFLERAGVKP